jgi:hypothetical protein
VQEQLYVLSDGIDVACSNRQLPPMSKAAQTPRDSAAKCDTDAVPLLAAFLHASVAQGCVTQEGT